MIAFNRTVAFATAAVFGATLVTLATASQAATLVYNDTTAAGNSTYPFIVSDNFTVNEGGLTVTNLAVFDSTKGTINTDLYVGLYNDTTNSVVIAPVDFNGTAYNGTGGSYYVTMAVTPVSLISGDTYSVEAYGFNNTFLYVDTSGPSAVTFNGSPGLSNVSSSNENGQAGSPLCNMITGANCSGTNFNTHPDDFFGAGSLVVTPLPAALPLFAGGLGLVGMFARRRKQKASAISAA